MNLDVAFAFSVVFEVHILVLAEGLVLARHYHLVHQTVLKSTPHAEAALDVFDVH